MADDEFSGLFPPSVARMQWPQTFAGKNRTYIGGIGSASYYQPTPRDRLIGVLHDVYGDSPEARHRIAGIMERADFFASTPFGAYDATRAIGEGRYKDAVIPGITATAPFLAKPAIKLAGAVGRRLGAGSRHFAETSDIAANVRETDNIRNGQTGEVLPRDVADISAPAPKDNPEAAVTFKHASGADNQISSAMPPVHEPVDLPRQGRIGTATDAAGPFRRQPTIGSKATPTETPGPALNEKRLASQDLDQTIAENGRPTTGRSGTTRKIESSAGRSDDIPDQYFLTEGLGEMRHNYPPDYAIAGDINSPPMGKADDSLSEVAFADAKKRGIYAPPEKPKRRFEEDYAKGVNADEIDGAEKLLVDRHGKPFAPGTMIFGRHTRGGDDVGATHRDFKELSKRLGTPVKAVPRDHIEGKPGTVPFDPDTNDPYGIFLADDLDMKKSRSRHIAEHEVMHALDLKTGREAVPPEIWKEMESIYSTLATGKENLPKPTLPADNKYSGPQIRDELVAESFRAALKDPNYMKTVAPKVYDWLADRLVRHPHVGVRLNSLAAATVAALGAMGQQKRPEAAETSPRTGSPVNSLRGMNSVSAPSLPFELMDRTKSADVYGFTRLAKALAESRTVPETAKNGQFRDIARTLANLKAKQNPQFYGGPR